MRNPDLQKAQVRNPDLAVGALNSLYPPSPVRNPQRALARPLTVDFGERNEFPKARPDCCHLLYTTVLYCYCICTGMYSSYYTAVLGCARPAAGASVAPRAHRATRNAQRRWALPIA